MDDKKKVPVDGPNGVDRFTSNGYGLRVNGKKVEPVKDQPVDAEDIDEIED